MAAEILGSGVLGVVAILILGGLLALSAAFLPRLIKLEELGGEAKWGMGAKTGPAPRTEPVSSPETAGPVPVPPPREPQAAGLETGEDEDLVAAAIALALSLYQPGERPVRQAEAAFQTGSPWALSGRWQAMQARINMQKR